MRLRVDDDVDILEPLSPGSDDPLPGFPRERFEGAVGAVQPVPEVAGHLGDVGGGGGEEVEELVVGWQEAEPHGAGT